MDTKTTLEEMDRKALQEIRMPQHQAEPQKKEERLFPALFITEDLKAVVGMDETLKGYMKDLKETDSTLSQTMEKTEKLRADYTSLYGDMKKQITSMQEWEAAFNKALETNSQRVVTKLSQVLSCLQDREERIIRQTEMTEQAASSVTKELIKMGRFLTQLEKRQKKLLRGVLIPASLLALLIVVDLVLRIIFR